MAVTAECFLHVSCVLPNQDVCAFLLLTNLLTLFAVVLAMDLLRFHPAVDDILSFVVFQAVTIGVTYRIPSDVLGLAPDEEEDGLPPSRDTDDLEFAAHYLQHQVGLRGTSHADLQTFPYTFRVGHRSFLGVPYVLMQAQQFRPVRILPMLATSRWFLRRCFALGFASPRVDVDRLRHRRTAQDFLDILDGSSHCEIHCSYDLIFYLLCRRDSSTTRFYEANPLSLAGTDGCLVDWS